MCTESRCRPSQGSHNTRRLLLAEGELVETGRLLIRPFILAERVGAKADVEPWSFGEVTVGTPCGIAYLFVIGNLFLELESRF